MKNISKKELIEKYMILGYDLEIVGKGDTIYFIIPKKSKKKEGN